MPRYTVQSPLKHDRKRYAVGDPIDLNNAAVYPLVEQCVIGTFVEKEKTAKAPLATLGSTSTVPALADGNSNGVLSPTSGGTGDGTSTGEQQPPTA